MTEQLIGQLAEIEKLREEAAEAKMQALKTETATERIRLRDQQLAALQLRLESLHAAKLLADEELYAVEDIIADCDAEDDRVSALVALSGKMAADKAFARQLRRKYGA